MLQALYFLLIVSTRAPAKGATANDIASLNSVEVSTRAPAKGATLDEIFMIERLKVSTRAPAKGATAGQSSICSNGLRFNSRSREGSDANGNIYPFALKVFQLALPRRERPRIVGTVEGTTAVSTRAPAKGATTVPKEMQDSIVEFQLALPRRERRKCF